MSPANVERIQALGRRIGFIKGRVVFTEGQPVTEALLLTEGRLAMTVGEGDERCIVGDVWPGELAGERAFFDGAGIHQVTVTAAANSRALFLDREAITQLEGSGALLSIQQHMVHTLLRRLQGTDLAVRKAWQEVRAAEAKAKAGDQPTEEQVPLVVSLRNIFNKLLGGA
jgi:CRP-like cAMP-binding protein